MANTVTITVDADTKKAETNVKGMGGKMSKALKGVAMASGALTLAAAGAAKLGQEYQEATNTIAAGTGATGEQLEGLTKSFEDVWATVPQDAAAVSAAIADINTEMGLEGALLENVTRAFLDVSRAMGEEAGPMIKAVADSMVQFGVPAEETRSRLDKLTAVSQAVGVGMTELADKVVKLGPQFQAMGFSLDEATALVGNMEAAGINSAKVMRGLNTAVKELTDEGVTDIQGGLRDMIKSIQDADTDAQATTIAMDLFGESGLRFKDAIDKGVFSLDEMLAAMVDSEGKVADLGAVTLTTSDKFDILKNRVKGALTPIGNFATMIGPMVIMIPTLATGISALAASQAIATAATWLQTAAMTALNIAMGPIGLIIIGIALAIGGIILAIKNWDKVTAAFGKVWDTVWSTIKRVFKPVVDYIEGVIDGPFAWLLPGGALIKALFFLRDNWEEIWGSLSGTVSTVVNGLKTPINLMIGLINAVIGGLNKIAFDIPNIPGLPGRGTRFGINIPMIPSLAQGGIVNRPTLAMIGERGPEAVVPLGKAGGVGGITINILGPTYGFDDFSAKVSQAVRDGVRRGGYQGVIGAA